jgi:uncharacterized hydrophobic protein (TIGR00271 family)
MSPDTHPAGASVRVDNEIVSHRNSVRQAINSGSKLDKPYVFMNAMATVVASYGLLEDSPAVVIGAMVIATLLGPIMALALGLVEGDTALLRRALIVEGLGALLVVLISLVIGWVHRDLPLTHEILSRTTPNLLDLMIALAGGAAGAYATVTPSLSAGLVGVAIATALVPPLGACGICLSRGDTSLAAGAFILFLTNLVAIQCASSVVMFVSGFHWVTDPGVNARRFKFRLIVDGAAFILLAAFLFSQLERSVQERQFEDGVKSAIEAGLKSISGAYLVETRYRAKAQKNVVVAVVRVPNSITPQETETIQKLMPRQGGLETELHVRSLLTKETTAKGYVYVGPSVDDPEADVPTRVTPGTDPAATDSPDKQ